MTYNIVVQRVVSDVFTPETKKLKQWTKAALQTRLPSAEVTLRIVGIDEIQELNNTYRHKNKPTNVLSFPYDTILGDIVICAAVVNKEAKEQNKTELAHWAHMVVHGTLHLMGHDHVNDNEAEIMEQEEINILKSLGFSNPYQITEKGKSHE